MFLFLGCSKGYTVYFFFFLWKKEEQAQLEVPHSRIQVELGFILQAGTCQILNFAQTTRQNQSVQGKKFNWGGGEHRTEKVYTGSIQKVDIVLQIYLQRKLGSLWNFMWWSIYILWA